MRASRSAKWLEELCWASRPVSRRRQPPLASAPPQNHWPWFSQCFLDDLFVWEGTLGRSNVFAFGRQIAQLVQESPTLRGDLPPAARLPGPWPIPWWAPLGVAAGALLLWLLIATGVGGALLEAPVPTAVRLVAVAALLLLPSHGRSVPPPPGAPAAYARWLLPDHLDSVVAVVETSGLVIHRRVFYPFGGIAQETTGPTEWTEQSFTGQRFQEETGIYDFQARWYDPEVGRFLSQDPLAVLDDPQLFNPYSYARSSPTTFSDPTGLYTINVPVYVPLSEDLGVSSSYTIELGAGGLGSIAGIAPVNPITNLGVNPIAGVDAHISVAQSTAATQSTAMQGGLAAQGQSAAHAGDGRPLSGDEISAARTVFGDKIDYGQVRVYDDKYFPLQGENVVMAPNGNLYWPGECGNLASCGGGRYAGTFIHEMTHVLQYQHGVNVLGRGFLLHTGRFLSLGAYDPYRLEYDPARSFRSYNIEQQGEIARGIFYGRHPNNIDY